MSRTRSTASRQCSLFDPKTGAFAVNIRDISGNDSELRESLKKFGWVEELPALVDENGVVLVGHRRLKTIASNIGFKPMTPKDRQRIAEHLLWRVRVDHGADRRGAERSPEHDHGGPAGFIDGR